MREIIFGALGRISDTLTVAEHAVTAPLFRRKGIDVRLTRTREERVTLLTEVLRKLNEEGDIKEIKAALGGYDGDLDEFAEALIGVGIVPATVRVVKTPEGPAPEEVRRSWVGVELLAVKLPPGHKGRDFITGEPGQPREAYAVLTTPSIEKLRQQSPEAADWFQQNFPPDLPALAFGADEVELV